MMEDNYQNTTEKAWQDPQPDGNATQLSGQGAAWKKPLPPKKKSNTKWIIMGVVAIIALPLLIIGIGIIGFVAETFLFERPHISSTSTTTSGPTALDRLESEQPDTTVYYEPQATDTYSQMSGLEATNGGGHLQMQGTLGGYDDAVLSLSIENGGTVQFTANGVATTRDVTFDSYDAATGRLVLNEFFANGGYIGKFDGVLTGGNYRGVFTNERTNGRVDFNFNNR